MAKKVFGPCALCLEDRQLCRSHVLPEFMYEKSRDEDGSFVSVTSHPHHRPKVLWTGVWEHLLCTECEARLSRYETYAAGLLRALDAVPYEGQQGIEVEYDYHRFKLFGVSLLWRSHLAKTHTHQSFSVGPLAEDMRRMLLSDEPGLPRCFPFGLARVVGSAVGQQTVIPLTSVKSGGHHTAFLMAYGFNWLFVTSRKSEKISVHMPLVGFTPRLMVAFNPTTDARLIAWLRKRLPASAWR